MLGKKHCVAAGIMYRIYRFRCIKFSEKLLKSSLEGFKDRKPSGMIGLIRFGGIEDDISSERNDLDDRKLLVLVVVEENDSSEIVWKETNGGATTEVRVTSEKLPALIHDIYFDVLIANSFPIKKSFKKFAPDIIFQNKLKYCKDSKLESYFGRSGEKAGYTSIVSCFRNSDKINDISWNDAMKSWEDFVDVFGEDLEVCSDEELVYQIKRKHLKGGSIGSAKLSKAITELEPFQAYYLLLTEKRPKREKDRHRVRTSLKKASWQQYMWHIVPANEIVNFQKHIQNGYISAYKFVR